MSLLIKNGKVINPATNTEEVLDVLLEGEKVVAVAQNIETEAERVIDASDCYVMPGFIDLHVHFRDPGLTYKEDLRTGGMAAVKGGVTTVVAMPNTKPVIDTREKVEAVNARALRESPTKVIQLGAVTKGQEGKELSEIAAMGSAGCFGISEDGKSVMDSGLYKEGMKVAAANDLVVFAHCEDINLVKGGVANADENAKRLGLKGITNSVEDVIVARDIILAGEVKGKLHLCHCSTKDSIRMVKEAKEAGIRVTAEVCPHHFILTTDDIKEDDGNFKMNPPLRTKADVLALREGLKSGVIDAIATDHAPHSEEEKNVGFAKAAFGIVGLETSAALTYTELVLPGVLSIMQMAERMSVTPAKILGLSDRGNIAPGMNGDVVIFDPEKEGVIDKNNFVSKGKNTPFDGRKVKGEVRVTIVDGNVVYERE
ncbi:dihydroorotase [Lachnospiraceae bacterium PF1-21]|uniref:dihydroorotase n=1 Tax=Ohessyouella blattaphilus TaxID=2949333 RepID=UPI003E1ACA64